jgi:outer membrane lipoprotein-sorting protein
MKKLIFGAAVLALSVPVLAQTASTVLQAQNTAPQQMAAFTDPANVRADLTRIDGAMNATKSFSGKFVQYYSDGSVTTGQIYLRRPKNLRLEYDAPNPLLIVADNGMLVQHDKDLETYDRIPLSSTPVSYFLSEDLNLAEDTEVIALQKTPTQWRVTARDGSGNMEGAITMVFDARTLALQEWIIADDFGGETRVVLSNLRYNDRLDPRLFILRDDSSRRGR